MYTLHYRHITYDAKKILQSQQIAIYCVVSFFMHQTLVLVFRNTVIHLVSNQTSQILLKFHNIHCRLTSTDCPPRHSTRLQSEQNKVTLLQYSIGNICSAVCFVRSDEIVHQGDQGALCISCILPIVYLVTLKIHSPQVSITYTVPQLTIFNALPNPQDARIVHLVSISYHLRIAFH